MSRKIFTLLAVIVPVLILYEYFGMRSPNMRTMAEKVIILGFDGMDPDLLQKYMAEGFLPHFKKLAEQGAFKPLEATPPPESPVAWASFETGANPGVHNIYDFLVRDPQTYMPGYGMIEQEAPEFLWKLIPIKPPRVETLRRGTPFWVQAGKHGVRATVLTVPLSFPPDEIQGGYMLAGLPLPDIRGNLGRYSYWATDLSDFEMGDTEFGGNLSRLEFDGDTASASVVGPISPILKEEQEELRRIPKDQRTIEQQARYEELSEPGFKDLKIDIRIQKASGGARIELPGGSFVLKKGQWSEWQDFTFKITPIVRVHGISQFLLLEEQPEIKLFMSPINWDPRDPPLPITNPDNWSKKLVKEVGMFRTLGGPKKRCPLLKVGSMKQRSFKTLMLR
ncbi:alkaline phosphatase family protein [bacterium]|nr:alkaline phosphatase family protein [bacterium]